MNITDKHAIIKLKTQGCSNRKTAEILGINRKTVARYWNEYLAKNEKLNDPMSNTKQVQEDITSTPKYNSSNRKSRKYSDAIDQALNLILESELEKLKLLGSIIPSQKLKLAADAEHVLEAGSISSKIGQQISYMLDTLSFMEEKSIKKLARCKHI